MGNFELNKILGWMLAALFVVTSVRLVTNEIYDPGSTAGLSGPQAALPSAASQSAPAPEKPLAELLKLANIDRGKRVAKKCISCHTFNKGEPNRIGPNLWDIVNRKTANVQGFNYSAALKKHGKIWGYEALAAFLKKPREYVSGTNMSFAGLRKPEDRAAIILYLRSLSDKPSSLP